MMFHGFPWSNKVELHATAIGPIFQSAELKFDAMIDRDGPRPWFLPAHRSST